MISIATSFPDDARVTPLRAGPAKSTRRQPDGGSGRAEHQGNGGSRAAGRGISARWAFLEGPVEPQNRIGPAYSQPLSTFWIARSLPGKPWRTEASGIFQ